MNMHDRGETPFQNETLLAHLGRNPREHAGLVNVPVCRGSTILADTLEEWESKKTGDNPMANYGRFGSPLSRAFESAVCALEGGHRSIVFPSGLSACTHALLGLVKTGDHVLLADSVYGPTRTFADQVLRRMGVAVEYFDPSSIDHFSSLLRETTSVVYVEAPGSLTFDIQDIPAIAALAHAVGAYVVMDNTWATPLYFKPFEKGVDVSIHAATKYLVGHSDALMGVATANERAWDALRASAHHFGETAGPDDIYLALRGLRTLGVRMKQHWASGVQLATALADHPAVRRIIHPALPSHPDHALWLRDFSGASGLFGVELHPMSKAQLSVLFRELRLFGIGLSWGGFESLALLVDPPPRAIRSTDPAYPLLRLNTGLENPNDLIADLTQALDTATRFGRADLSPQIAEIGRG